MKNKRGKLRKNKEDCKRNNHQLQKTKKKIKLQKKRQYELNKRRVLNRKQNETNKETKQNERKQIREKIIDKHIEIGKFIELASSDKIYVTGLNLQETQNEFSLDYESVFELNGSMVIGRVEGKTNIR